MHVLAIAIEGLVIRERRGDPQGLPPDRRRRTRPGARPPRLRGRPRGRLGERRSARGLRPPHELPRPARIDDTPVWSIVCFVVSKTARGQGLTSRLLDAAMDYARAHGAPALEAYPVDAGEGRVPAAVGYTGHLSTFRAAGFRVVHEIDSPQATVRRVIVRRDA
ncbi:MAG: GNAT family N-acetyltransferase [Chloroflexi bacterium]|nr:GNAT family N-acetyltransferase [Chloroflexota bacterium]